MPPRGRRSWPPGTDQCNMSICKACCAGLVNSELFTTPLRTTWRKQLCWRVCRLGGTVSRHLELARDLSSSFSRLRRVSSRGSGRMPETSRICDLKYLKASERCGRSHPRSCRRFGPPSRRTCARSKPAERAALPRANLALGMGTRSIDLLVSLRFRSSHRAGCKVRRALESGR